MFSPNTLFLFYAILMSSSLSSCILFTQTPYTAANCAGFDGEDFGDEPDQAPTGYTAPGAAAGAFPSRRSSDGPRAEVRCRYRIGEYVTVENGYTDPGDPDPINPRGRPPGSNVPKIISDYDDGFTYD